MKSDWFSSPLPSSVCLTEWFCLTCLTGITPERKWLGCLALSLPSTPPSALSAILRLAAVLFITLAHAMASSGLAPVCVPCRVPRVCRFAPAMIPTPASLPQPARLRHHPVPGGQEAGAAGSRLPWCIPEPWERILGEIHISVRSLLPFIAEQSSSELYMGLTPVGVHGEPTSTQQPQPCHSQVYLALFWPKKSIIQCDLQFY